MPLLHPLTDINAFKISVSDQLLADLKTKLELTRYPQELNLPGDREWEYGVPVKHVKELVDYWKSGFDWRAQEKYLNEKLPQFTTPIDTGDPAQGVLTVHFAHFRSRNPRATPLLISHGWPGNFFEAMKIAAELMEPTDPQHPAFHVVCPSIPGFGFSEAPRAPGFGVRATANVFNKLMIKLGYEHYVAQGGDWGGPIVRAIAIWHPTNCRGILTNLLVVDPKLLLWNPLKAIKLGLGFLGLPGGYSEREINGVRRAMAFRGGAAYMTVQSAMPQTLGFSMTDSPAGLLAWLFDKYHNLVIDYKWTKDEILTWVMMYYICGPTPSFRFYKENGLDSQDMQLTYSMWSDVPLGVSLLAGESVTFPDDFGSMVQPLKYHRRHDVGGHFAAWEVPKVLLTDIRTFFKSVILEDPLLHT